MRYFDAITPFLDIVGVQFTDQNEQRASESNIILVGNLLMTDSLL